MKDNVADRIMILCIQKVTDLMVQLSLPALTLRVREEKVS